MGFCRVWRTFVNFHAAFHEIACRFCRFPCFFLFFFGGVLRSLVSSCGIFMGLYVEFRNIINGYNMQSLLEFNEVL